MPETMHMPPISPTKPAVGTKNSKIIAAKPKNAKHILNINFTFNLPNNYSC